VKTALRGVRRDDGRDDAWSDSFEDSVSVAKRRLRAAIVGERHRLSSTERAAAARGLKDALLELPLLREATRVGMYVSRSDEPDTHPLREALAARGVEVVYPAVAPTGVLRWLTSPDSVQRHRLVSPRRRRLPILVPVDTTQLSVVLVPALAVDTQGRRLGGGFDGYDNILRRLDPSTIVIAIVQDTELFDSAVEPVPEEPHDVRVHAALTPSRICYFNDLH
jgi:5-formyltetrahydrofolate cyclo-ligase